MHNFQIKRNLDDFMGAFAQISSLHKLLADLVIYDNAFRAAMFVIFDGTNNAAAQAQSAAKQASDALRTTVSSGSAQLTFLSITKLQQAIEKLDRLTTADVKPALSTQVSAFTDAYDAYLNTRTADTVLPLFQAAVRLRGSLETALSLVKGMASVIESADSQDAPDGQMALSIWLPSPMPLKDFANRLLALQSAYSELCMLYGVSEADYPLRMAKVESGSLWAKVFGDTKMIETLISMLKASAAWMHRNYTDEGKLEAFPRKVEAVDSLLGLRTRMQAAGLDTVAMQAQIDKCAVTISEDLSTLLSGQRAITLNDQMVQIAPTFDSNLLNGPDTLNQLKYTPAQQ
jgi:hypothetical protein